MMETSNQEEQTEIFTDEMNEEQLIEAFNNSRSDETTAEEPIVEEPKEEVEEPTEEVTEDVDTSEATEEVTTEEESSLDVIDFANPVLLKDRDLELPVNNSRELLDLARQGLNFTRKTQDFAKSKPLVDYAQKHGISMDDLQALAEAKSGSTDALGKIAKDSNIDVLDVDAEKQYEPNQDYTPHTPTEVETFAQELQQDTATADKFRGMMDYAPESFKTKMSNDVETLKAFATDVKNGVAEKLMPEALKLHAINGGDFVQSYIQAGNTVYGQEQQAPTPVEQSAPTIPAPVSENRAKAGISSSATTSSNSMEFDTWGSSDSDFLKKINELTRG